MGIQNSVAKNIQIVKCEFFNNNRGVMSMGDTNVTYSDNNFQNNYFALYIYRSDNSTINNSVLINNTYAFYFTCESGNPPSYYPQDSEITYCDIKENNVGVKMESSFNNYFHHNNFINNENQTILDDNINYWDDGYPSGGNYWSDYTGSDFYSGPNQDQPGSDGIGDTNYSLDQGNNVDKYPLMSPVTQVENKIHNLGLLTTGGENDGWNFISFNLTANGDNYATSNDLLEILNDDEYGISGSYDKVMYYDSSEKDWKTFLSNRPAHYNNLKTWDNTMGIWIHMTSDDTLSVEGTTPISTDILLEPGWNMVGYPSETNQLASDALPPEVSKIGIFNKWAPYNIEYIYDLSTEAMVAGRGYWVYNDANYSVTWTVNY